MKKTLLSATAITAAMLAPLAQAADGTVDFAGKLVSQTCTIDVDGRLPNATVILPKVTTGALTTAGQTTGQTGFSIGLSNCAGAAKSASAFFEHTSLSKVDPVTGNLETAYTDAQSALNVQVQLLDAFNGNAIRVGDTSQLTSTTQVPIDASGNARLRYAAQYYATGAATAGRINPNAYFSINYQ